MPKKDAQIRVPQALWEEAIECMALAEDRLEYAGKLGCTELSRRIEALRRKMEDISRIRR